MDGTRHVAGHPLELGEAGRQRFVEQVDDRRRAAGRRSTGARPRSRGASAPNRLMVSAKARGRSPSSARTSDSPSSTSGSAGSAEDRLDDLGQPVRDLLERAREDADVVAVAVHLDARAVELVVDVRRGRTGERLVAQRLCHRLGAGGEHRADRRAAPAGPRRSSPGSPPVAGQQRGLGERAGEHPRPAHRRRRHLGGDRNGLGEQRLERALPHLAQEHAREEPALVGGRPRQQRRQHGPPVGGRGGRGEAVERGVDVDDAERLAGGRRRCPRPPPPGRR